MTSSSLLTQTTALSLPEVVYREVRNAILNGVYVPGQMLRQDEMANRLGVSRSPLREALPRLEAEGIVVLHPRRGYAVAELRTEEIQEVFKLRALLETEIAKQAIRRRTEEDIARVYALAAEMRKLVEAERTDDNIKKWFEFNESFHSALLSPAGMPHFMRSLLTANSLIEVYFRNEMRLTGDMSEAQREHAALARAFVEGDEAGFVNQIAEHAHHNRDRLLHALQQQAALQI